MPSIKPLLSCWVALFIACFCAPVAWSIPPDTNEIFAEAAKSAERVLYSQDFESDDGTVMQEWHGPEPHRIVYSGVTDETAYAGRRCYKIETLFNAKFVGGEIYFRIPMEFPIWSEIKIRMHVKPVLGAGIERGNWRHGGSLGELFTDANTLNGRMVAEENGWQVWEATAKPDGRPYFRVTGPALMASFPGKSDSPVSMTYYVDNVTVTGKLPENWKERWKEVWSYYNTQFTTEQKAVVERRIADMRRWRDECEKTASGIVAPQGKYGTAVESYNAVLREAKSHLEAATLALSKDDVQTLTEPERHLASARFYADRASSYSGYVKKHPANKPVTWAVDITGSSSVLPDGPNAQKEELSFYACSETGVVPEAPQVLPDTVAVPGVPTDTLSASGCRGTVVPVAFAIRSSDDLPGLTFTISDLKSGKKTLPRSIVDLKVALPWYRPFNGQQRFGVEVFAHDPEFAIPDHASKANIFKNVKYPKDAPKLLPVSIPANNTRLFYATVRIPDKTASGVYRGTITGKSGNTRFSIALVANVLPFDLEATPYDYSVYHRVTLATDEEFEKHGLTGWARTPEVFEQELRNMADHGFNILNLYDGYVKETANGLDFSVLDRCLSMAKRAGLTKGPFMWLGHPFSYIANPANPNVDSMDKVKSRIASMVPEINRFCDERKYPRPAYYGEDEASGDFLVSLLEGYRAVNQAGGTLTVACSSGYYFEVGDAISLPIVSGGTQWEQGQASIARSHSHGYRCWIYAAPFADLFAAPASYRRRYGLGLWKNGEDGAADWAYADLASDKVTPFYESFRTTPSLYCLTYPTVDGPIDTIIYEAYREGIYDTRYLATLQGRIKKAKAVGGKAGMTAQNAEKWLGNLSINSDVNGIRKSMIDYILKIDAAAR